MSTNKIIIKNALLITVLIGGFFLVSKLFGIADNGFLRYLTPFFFPLGLQQPIKTIFSFHKKKKNRAEDRGGYIKKLDRNAGHMEHVDSVIFQPTGVRYNPILVSESDWKSLARQFRYVFYYGIILWTGHLITVAIFS